MWWTNLPVCLEPWMLYNRLSAKHEDRIDTDEL